MQELNLSRVICDDNYIVEFIYNQISHCSGAYAWDGVGGTYMYYLFSFRMID